MKTKLNTKHTPFKTSVLSAAVSLTLGLGATVGQAAVTSTGGNFSMLDSAGGKTGGTNNVAFSWDETFRFSVPVSGNVPNATISSASPFFGHLWTAAAVTIYGPGTYTFESHCPAGSPLCTGATVNYVPKPGFTGTDSFTYTIVDARGGVATATVNVTVTAVNDAPLVNKDLINTTQNAGAAVAINPTLNDSDVEGDTLTVTTVGTAVNGTAALASGTSVSYIPNAGFFGLDSFTYTVSDGNGGSTDGIVYVGVNQTTPSVNALPVVSGSLALTVAEDSIVSSTTPGLTGVTDPTGDVMTILFRNNGTRCSPYGTGTGIGCSLTAATAKNYVGPDSFIYAIADSKGGVVTRTTNVTITAVNDAPVASADALVTNQNAAAVTIDPRLNDVDVDGNPLSITAVGAAVNGVTSFTATGVTYTPNAGFFGRDSFTYTLSDGVVSTIAGTLVNVAVSATGNNPPVAVDDVLAVNEDSATVNAYLNSVYSLINDSDPDADKLKPILATSLAANGTSSFTVGNTFGMTVGLGQVGGHMLFAWNGALDIDLVNVWAMDSVFGNGVNTMVAPSVGCGSECGGTSADPWSGVATTVWDGASSDIDLDGVPGLGFVDGPFFGFNGNFNLMGLRPLVPPTANAGADGNDLENLLVTLTGTCAATDTTVSGCAWISVDPAITLSCPAPTGLGTNSATATCTFTTPTATTPATVYTFTLTTTDNLSAVATDSMAFRVGPPADPVADAGAYQTVAGGDGVTLTGACTGAATLITGCTWTSNDPSITLTLGAPTGIGTNAASATATFTAPAVTANTPFFFTLTAVDNHAATADGTDTQVVTVQIAPVTVYAPAKKSGCSLSAAPQSLSQHGDWWILAGFMAWLGGLRYRRGFGGKR